MEPAVLVVRRPWCVSQGLRQRGRGSGRVHQTCRGKGRLRRLLRSRYRYQHTVRRETAKGQMEVIPYCGVPGNKLG